jgi:DNA end-binding protein Ku
VEILHSVKNEDLDPRYLDRPYILRPSGNSKEFGKLAGSLFSSGRAAVCRWVMRNRTYLGLLKFERGLLWMLTLRYGSEVVPLDSVEIKQTEFKKKEVKTARDLIDAMTEDFDPEKFKNNYRKEMLKVIEKKQKGGEVEIAPEPELESTQPDQLIEALEKSLEKAGGKAGA